MASSQRPKTSESAPVDLLPVMRSSGILSERQLAEIKSKMLQGDYPLDSTELADRLVNDRILTAFQAKRFLGNRPHGLIVGRYTILDRIGSGSMGRVYKAHHMMMDRIVALKIIAPEIASNDRVVARFQREMKLVGRLDHPNVVRAFDADQVNKVLYIVMEYVPGLSLSERLKKGTIPLAEMVDYAAQACQGLAHAHGQGIVHRDIKPSNILLTEDRKVKILDLGLGVLMEADSGSTFETADGIAVGTVDYMSPEQACGREVDGRSDLYGLACSMYHLMTGKLPFPGDSPIERLGKRISGRHVPITEYLPDAPSNLVRVMDRMMAHKPHERYATAIEASEALQNLIRPKPRPVAPKEAAPDKAAAPDQPPAGEAPAPPEPKTSISAPAQPLSAPRTPDYPAWFRPLATLAEHRPGLALLGIVSTALAAFGLGLAAGFLIR